MKISVEQNKGLTQHMQAEVESGKVTLIHFERKETGEGENAKIELIEKARIEFPAKDSDEAYKILEHFRWASGKCLKAIKASSVDVNAALKVADAPAAGPKEPVPGSPEEQKQLEELVNEDNKIDA